MNELILIVNTPEESYDCEIRHGRLCYGISAACGKGTLLDVELHKLGRVPPEARQGNIGKRHKKRIYISGPITGIDNYQEKFKAAEEKLLREGYEPVNPASMGKELWNWMRYEEVMELDLCLLGMCSSVYMLKGWEQSKGANREYGYALAKRMEILFE